MNPRLVGWVLPLVVLVAVSGITVGRLREAAALRRGEATSGNTVNPYAGLAHLEEHASEPRAPGAVRNPFAFGGRREPVAAGPARPAPRPAAPARPRPVLTAIVSDADPRAVVQYEGRSYTVKPGDLFAEFRVVSVTAERVVLEAGAERIVLNRPTKGE